MNRSPSRRRFIFADTCPATPQQPTKHLTDEELKQQYGIHLATRIQADGDGKEAKWADIDDDEDDWAPETIEWNDGTKITLSQHDSAALLAEEQAAVEAAHAREEEQKKKARAAAQQKSTTTVGPNATVLKPRSAAQPKPGNVGLVLKTPAEKSTLVSKPAAPTPSKSPWAPLPAFDKPPPVMVHSPARTVAPQPQESEGQPSASTRLPPPPTMEIAADSFRRNARDSQNDNIGQLFNAQSGKYEPASTGRRGSIRNDGNFRPPSLLQRGGSAHEAPGPAEPSLTLPNRRVSQGEHGHWEARKSSIVSGDNGRRQSVGKGADFPPDRRGSQQSQAIQSPATPGVGPSPTLQHSQPPQETRSTAGSPYQAKTGAAAAAGPPGERPDVAQMKILMKEKRDMAIKRRQEQEEREEAEKKERIRKKMEELGMEPLVDKRDAPAKEAPPKTIEKRPTEPAQTETADQAVGESAAAASKDAKQPPHSPSIAARSPPKPPAPSASGPPQQYGLIKVHSVPPRDALQQINETLHVERLRIQPQAQKVSPPGLDHRPETDKRQPAPLVNGIVTQKPAEPLFQRSPELQNRQLARDPPQQPWNNGPRDHYAGWSAQNAPREPNNVWGSASPSRPLGNGTFDRTIQRPRSRQQDQHPSPALAPIGPPKHLQPQKGPRNSGRGVDIGQASAAEDSQTVPSFPPSEAPQHHRAIIGGRAFDGEPKISPHGFAQATPLGPQRADPMQPAPIVDRRGPTVAASGSEDADQRRQLLEQQHDIRPSEGTVPGVRREPQPPAMNETRRPVRIDEQGVGRSAIGGFRTQNGLDLATHVHAPTEIRGPPFVSSMDAAPAMPGGLGRGSRFFPTAGRGLHPYHQTPGPFGPFHRRSDSPPPPDSFNHPAYSADPRRIVVRLPLESRFPKPKVRLPPPVITPVQSPQLAQVQPLPMRAASQPLVNNPSWQDRFNGLLGVKKSSPEKSPERKAVRNVDFSATKEPLDIPAARLQAAVALPPQHESSGAFGLHVASKDPSDEEALFEPESGSTPAVLFPQRLTQPAWSAKKPLKRNQLRAMVPSDEVEVATSEVLRLPDVLTRENLLLVFVRMMGMSSSKSRPMRPPPGYVPVREPQGHQNSPRQQTFTRGPKPQGKEFKPRESSGNFGQGVKGGNSGPQKIGGHAVPRNSNQRSSAQQPRAPSKAQESRLAA